MGPAPRIQTASQKFLGYINTQLSPEVLGEVLHARTSYPVQERARVTEEMAFENCLQLALTSGGRGMVHQLMDVRNRSFLMASTFFGRHHFVVDRLRAGNILPERAVRILQGGAGLYSWHSFRATVPDIDEFVERLGYQGEGISYEMAELANLASDSGSVTVVEFDERIVEGIKETLKFGMILDKRQPFGRYGIKPGLNESSEYYGWLRYMNDFVSQVNGGGEVSSSNQVTHLGISEVVASRIYVERGDLATHAIEQNYDLIWLLNMYRYFPEPLWWSILVRSVSQLSVADGQDRSGGLLVMDKFHADYVRNFMALSGMSIWAEIDSPLEYDSTVVIARRTVESTWLDEQSERLNRFHSSFK